MSDQLWFTKKPGQLPVNEEESSLLVGGEVPDWVELPPNLGGQKVRVLRTFEACCPVTGVICRHLELEDGINVAESDKFYWYRRRRAEVEAESSNPYPHHPERIGGFKPEGRV